MNVIPETRRAHYIRYLRFYCMLCFLDNLPFVYSICIKRLSDWCLAPTLAVFQLHRGVNKFYTFYYVAKESIIVPHVKVFIIFYSIFYYATMA